MDEVEAIADAFGVEITGLTPIQRGLINRTFRVSTPSGPLILQRVSPIFDAGVNANIRRVTEHLSARGVETPRLRQTQDGANCANLNGGVWRMMTMVEGHSVDRLSGPSEAEQAGRALARFHRALADFDGPLDGRRTGVHDTSAHLKGLRAAIRDMKDHPLHAAVAGLSVSVFESLAVLPDYSRLPDRLVHGDPKVNNLIWRSGAPAAWVDLDTVGRMKLPYELGDAFRSWCNTAAGEDVEVAGFDRWLFDAGFGAYCEEAADFITEAERTQVLAATHLIACELAARFLRDALEERYFGWDSERFSSCGAHNLARARGQLALAASIDAQTP